MFEIVATATDTAGNTATTTENIRFIDPNDTEAPEIELDLDQFGSNPVIREVRDLVGTIEDDLEFYRVEIAPISLINLNNLGANDPDFITIAEGNSGVDGVIAQIDSSLFRNDSHYLRVLTQDFSGNINVEGTNFSIDTPNKPGEFSQEFVDLSIPLTGVPIEITRQYSSLDANFSGDFGFGWDLGLQDANIVESSSRGVDLTNSNLLFGNTFTVGDRVTLNNPDGDRVGFTFQLQTESIPFFGNISKPVFVADPGVYETLEVPDVNLSLRSDGTVGLFFFSFPYNPNDYILTTRDGTRYTYDQEDGLETVEDRNGNILTFTNNGITSSTGVSIDFIRDNQGRITEITDPEGNAIEYGYDANGDLVSVTDREENKTTLKYEAERAHYLTEIIDPLGRSGTRVEYGDDGRISRFIDADGNALDIDFDFDGVDDFQTISDPLGNDTKLFYDDRGNVVKQIDPLGGETLTTYDDDNNILSQTDAENNKTTFTYDENGNILTQTDAEEKKTTFTYNEFSQLKTVTNALGDTENCFCSQGRS